MSARASRMLGSHVEGLRKGLAPCPAYAAHCTCSQQQVGTERLMAQQQPAHVQPPTRLASWVHGMRRVGQVAVRPCHKPMRLMLCLRHGIMQVVDL